MSVGVYRKRFHRFKRRKAVFSSVAVPVDATGFGRLEYTMPREQLEYTMSDERLEFTLEDERLEFTGLEP